MALSIQRLSLHLPPPIIKTKHHPSKIQKHLRIPTKISIPFNPFLLVVVVVVVMSFHIVIIEPPPRLLRPPLRRPRPNRRQFHPPHPPSGVARLQASTGSFFFFFSRSTVRGICASLHASQLISPRSGQGQAFYAGTRELTENYFLGVSCSPTP